MKKKLYYLTLALCGMLVSCKPSSGEYKNSQEELSEVLVGNDKDDHGCIGSAGYQWSDLLKDCIRPWEKGVKLHPVADSLSTSAAYLVFNADSSQIEVFLRERETTPILSKEVTDGVTLWKDGKSIQVGHSEKGWNIYDAEKLIYVELD